VLRQFSFPWRQGCGRKKEYYVTSKKPPPTDISASLAEKHTSDNHADASYSLVEYLQSRNNASSWPCILFTASDPSHLVPIWLGPHRSYGTTTLRSNISSK
jgi:hypothetical protein